MSLTPQQLFDFAAGLDAALSEAHARSAISRAYYALMHRADEIIPAELGRPTDRGSTHERVIEAVERHGAGRLPGRSLARQLTRALRELKNQRVDADYQLHENISAENARKCVARARTALSWCDDIDRQIGKNSPHTGG